MPDQAADTTHHRPRIHLFSVQFSLDANGQPQFAYLPSIADCRLNVAGDHKYAIFAFNLQPMNTTFWPAQFTSPKWSTSNGQQPSFITMYTPDSSANNNRMLLFLDENTPPRSTGNYIFQLQVLYGGIVYTAPDPIIVNKDTTGGDAPAVIL